VPVSQCPAGVTFQPTDLEADIIELFADTLGVRCVGLSRNNIIGNGLAELALTLHQQFRAAARSPGNITPQSSFTQRGGHSLLAMSLLTRMRAAFECPALQLADLLQDDCPNHLAAVIEVGI
jgi:hypothetical protein